MLVLVVGTDRVDAGKTTFSTGLLARTGGLGYKPRAGNDFWFDHDDCLEALAEGRLYGKDARKLAAAERADRRPERLNPVHRLWRPTPDEPQGLLGRKDRAFLVDRISHPEWDEPAYVHNATADIPDRVADALPIAASTPVESVDQLNECVRSTYAPAFDSVATELETAELAVVESYGDIADPLAGSFEGTFDVVAAVEPGRVRIFSGPEYARACSSVRPDSGDGRLEKRVRSVVASLDPLRTVSLPPLSDRQRSDPAAVADAYKRAYDALLEATRQYR